MVGDDKLALDAIQSLSKRLRDKNPRTVNFAITVGSIQQQLASVYFYCLLLILACPPASSSDDKCWGGKRRQKLSSSRLLARFHGRRGAGARPQSKLFFLLLLSRASLVAFCFLCSPCWRFCFVECQQDGRQSAAPPSWTHAVLAKCLWQRPTAQPRPHHCGSCSFFFSVHWP